MRWRTGTQVKKKRERLDLLCEWRLRRQVYQVRFTYENLLDESSKANGYANRFLWTCARRSRSLPEGGNIVPDSLLRIKKDIVEAIDFARTVERMKRDDDARRLWAKEYDRLSEGRPGMLGAITSRAEAQVLRLSMIFALLGKSDIIHPEQVTAAIEVWRYCYDSARYIFGDMIGDRIGDAILAALREARDSGLTQTEIYRDVFN